MLEEGMQVGNYVVGVPIGRGGMATLFKVRHLVLGTQHALKVLDPTHRQNAEIRQRFLAEGMIAAKLQHPGIVRVTDTVSTNEVAGLVMEYINGPNLEDYVRELGEPPTPKLVRSIFLQILAAVGEAHRHGVIHRDIKPSNILLEITGDQITAKVADFGIAKITGESDLEARKKSTHADARMGTLSYMSPEQIQRSRDVTVRSDIFSLGATLFELATGQVPFDGESDYEIMDKIVKGRPREWASGTDPVLRSVVRKALRPDPAARFGSCEEFAAALKSVVPIRSAPASGNAIPRQVEPTPAQRAKLSQLKRGLGLQPRPDESRPAQLAAPPRPPSGTASYDLGHLASSLIRGLSSQQPSIESLSPSDRIALGQHQLSAFPVWNTVLLHCVTGGLFSLIHFNSMHGRLPATRPNDPSKDRALGFMFIPLLNLYWLFFSPLRLIERLRFQLELRGVVSKTEDLRGLVRAAGGATVLLIVSLLAGGNAMFLIPALVLWAIVAARMQVMVNHLAQLGPPDAEQRRRQLSAY